MNVIVILCDTLVRNKLEPYHGGEGAYSHIRTPNLNRLAARGITFANHWINSAPCMPARRDLWSGRIEFPWRSWGPRESFDPDWTLTCRDGAVQTALFTDHANLFDTGGENYHVWFDQYEFVRGHYNDHCRATLPVEPGRRGQSWRQYAETRSKWSAEEETYVARNLSGVARWLEEPERGEQPFFLMVDEFDPHWPLDPPEPYRSTYLDDPALAAYDFGGCYHGGQAEQYEPGEIAWLQAQAAGKITLVDRWLGEVFDAMERTGRWDDTLLLLTTDHGEFVGEYGQMSKGQGFSYPLFSQIPLIACHPQAERGRRVDHLTCTVDIHATVLEALELPISEHCHGRSFLPMILGDETPRRKDVLYGWWGKGFYWTDGRRLVCKAPIADGPLYQYGTNLGEKYIGLAGEYFDRYAGAETGVYMPHTKRPVYRVPADGYCYAGRGVDFDAVFDMKADPQCLRNRWDEEPALRDECLRHMCRAMEDIAVPEEHYVRLGLERWRGQMSEDWKTEGET